MIISFIYARDIHYFVKAKFPIKGVIGDVKAVANDYFGSCLLLL